MRRRINLEFFGGGGSTTTTQVNKREDKTAEQKALDSQVYGLMSALGNRYGGQTVAGYSVPSTTSDSSAASGGKSDITLTDGGQTTRIPTSDSSIASSGKGGGTVTATGTSNNSAAGSNALGSVVTQNLDNADAMSAAAQANTQNILNTNEGYRTQQANTLNDANILAKSIQNQSQASYDRANGYLDDYDTLYGQYKNNNYGQGYLDDANSALQRAATAGNADYADAQSYYKQAADMAQNGTDFANAANYYAQAADIAQNGEDYAQASRANANLEKYIAEHGNDAAMYMSQLADLTKNANTNSDLQNYMAGEYDSINSNFNKSASNALAGAAARGIINSSTSNRAISDLAKTSQDTAAKAYATGFEKISNNYNNLINGAVSDLQSQANSYAKEAESSKALGDSRIAGLINSAKEATSLGSSKITGLNDSAKTAITLGAQKVGDLQKDATGYKDLYDSYNDKTQNALASSIASSKQAQGIGDSISTSGNRDVQNLLNTASGYGDLYNEGLTGLDKYASLPSTLYENALSPYSAIYDAWKQMNNNYYGHEDYDTVVSQSGGK